jgi:uncharacterized membrane protein
MITLACLITAVGVIVLGLSLPLVYRKVPMNAFYGMRIPASFASEQRWYDINAYGGRFFVRWSALIIASGLIGFFLPRSVFPVYQWTVLGIVLVCVLAPLVQVALWAGRQPKV